MKILVVYGTTEGHTRKICERVEEDLKAKGHDTVLQNTSRWQENFQVESYDKLVIAGSVHAKKHQRDLEMFAIANREKMKAKPTLFLSVSLSAAFPGGEEEAQSYIDTFAEYTGWTPTRTLAVAGALRYDEYDYFMEQIVQHVVLEGRDQDQEEGDREFTDWDGLMSTVDEFVSS